MEQVLSCVTLKRSDDYPAEINLKFEIFLQEMC